MEVEKGHVTTAIGVFESSAKRLKQMYEQICAEWEDIDKALADLNHYQELMIFDEEGEKKLSAHRKQLLDERRHYKNLFHLLSPIMLPVAHAVRAIDEAKEQNRPKNETIYNIRSVRGYNAFNDISVHATLPKEQYFSDGTENFPAIGYIHSLHNNFPNLVNKVATKCVKEDATALRKRYLEQGLSQELQQIQERRIPILPKPQAEVEKGYKSLADKEVRDKWNEIVGDEEIGKEERTERQLRQALLEGKQKSKRR